MRLSTPQIEIDQDFSSLNGIAWQQTALDTGPLPYALGVAYFNPYPTIATLNAENAREATAAHLARNGELLTNGAGLSIACCYWPHGESFQRNPLTFSLPVCRSAAPFSSLLSDEHSYPRVTLPGKGPYDYAVTFEYSEGYFGKKQISSQLEIAPGTPFSKIELSHEVRARREIVQAIRQYHGAGENDLCPGGKFSVTLDGELIPLVSMRITGGVPCQAEQRRSGNLDGRLSASAFAQRMFKTNGTGHKTPECLAVDPFQSDPGTSKYIEIPLELPSSRSGEAIDIARRHYVGPDGEAWGTLSFERGNIRMFSEDRNAHENLVEVQVDCGFAIRKILVTNGSGSAPFSHQPQSKPAWFGHRHTFRFCLT